MERIEVNLLPAEYRMHSRGFRFRGEIVYPAVLFFLTVIGLGLMWINLKRQVTEKKDAIEAVDQKIAENRHIQNEINQLRTEQTLINQKIEALRKIDINRERWVRLQEIFSAALPDQTWLTAIEENFHEVQDGTRPTLNVSGKTLSFSEVAGYMSALQDSEYILDVGLSKVEQNRESKVYDFTVSCRVNPDAHLAAAGESFRRHSDELD